MNSNTSGNYNIAIGGGAALNDNDIGIGNTASGYSSLPNNISGNYNTAMGYIALNLSTTGSNNTSLGYHSSRILTTGSGNTAVGHRSLDNVSTGSNNIAIGYLSNVPDGAASNQVRIGGTAITYAGVQVAWTITSDKRWKNTIEDSDLGLDFINKLRPVSYFRNNDKKNKLEYGFIAQELQETLKNSSSKINGIITEDTEGMLSVRYNDLMAPMVKAIQEQTEEIQVLKSENEALKLRQEAMENELKEIKDLLLNKK
ncbi:hypothetical protein JCM19274_5594 [Algibacter lectus]|uniref:Peptidase S74 domain-containing protein n=2 Tax=Algibacter lectus TaxID=221126 RepID=A0A090WLK5_9FLAO|nr:hypothetical protein JCM19274_5594 [Algibacter lectus]